MGLFENATQDLNYKSTEIDTSNLTSTQFVNSNSISSTNEDVEVVDLDANITNTNYSNNSSDSKYVSEEDISDLIGTMSETEYQEFIQGINDYYDQNIEQCNDYIKKIDETLNELNNQLVKDSYSGYVRCDEECKQELIGLLRAFVDAKEYEGTGVTLEQIQNMTDDERIAYILKHSEEAKAIKQKWDSAKTEHENVLKEQLKDLKIKTFDEYQKNIDTLKATKANLQTQIENLNNNKKSSYYDNLQFLKEYSEYKAHVATQAEIEYVKGKALHELDYEEFSKKFPGVSKLDFLKIVHEEMPTYWGEAIPGIDAKEMSKLKTIVLASEKIPALEKTYNYLYSIDPKKADQFLQDAAYEINNIDGQIQAAAYLEEFHLEDGQANLSEFLFNEFGITLAGLTDGLNSFGDGCGYSMEALATILGITEENREMTAEEYKKMYIVYMLLDEETKLNAGLIKKNEDGTIENSDPLSFIDYTKKYKGGIVLKGSYNVSQGIGNMLPSVALSTVCPIAGSVALGVSAGGNSYHEAMVNGESLLSSTMYGVFNGCSEAITERLLGGLPGLSDVEVTSLKTYLMAMGREGFEESFQGVMDAIYKGTFMGEGFPTTNEEFGEFIKDIGIQGFYGAITAGIMQSPSLASIMTTKIEYNKIMNQNNISKADQKAAIKYLKENDTTGKYKGMSDEEIKIKNAEEILNIALEAKNNNQNTYNENQTGNYDGDVTEELDITVELPPIQYDGDVTAELDITAELPPNQTNEGNSYNQNQNSEQEEYYEQPVLNSQTEFNAMEMKNEINSKVTPQMNEVQKARTLYMELNKRISYDLNYNVGDINTKEKIYNTEVSFENLQDSSVVCKGWSELYRELLIENGFDANNVRLVRKSQTGARSHVWVEITLSDGNIIIADATDNINHSTDLANCKIGLATNGFVYTNPEHSGMLLKTAEAQYIVNFGRKQWQEIDSYLGYNNAGLYYDEILTKAKSLFGGKKIKNQTYSEKVNSMFSADFPAEIDGYDSYVYYNTIKRILFNEEDQQNIRINVAANYTGSTYEGITMASAKISEESTIYIVYSKSIGKRMFTNLTDYINYLNTLKIQNLK